MAPFYPTPATPGHTPCVSLLTLSGTRLYRSLLLAPGITHAADLLLCTEAGLLRASCDCPFYPSTKEKQSEEREGRRKRAVPGWPP
jgi:hypothetical protein